MTLKLRSCGAFALLVVGAACGAAREDARTDDLQAGDRAAIGRARPYQADLTLASKTGQLATSQKLRREVAWRAIEKILANAPIAETEAKVNGAQVEVPAFRTWYHKDDFERIFARAYQAHGAEKRKARAPFDAKTLDDAIDFNAKDRGAITEQQYFDRVRAADTETEAQGLGGNGKVSYSPAMLRHVMESWTTLSACTRGESPDDANALLGRNFARCLASEYPADAAAIKASWTRADFGLGVPVRPTTAEIMTDRMSGKLDLGGWGKGETDAFPTPSEIYTVKTSDGATFRMPALHLMTKEVREWLWITLWWSPQPDTDFGADRPAGIQGVWKNYKMCVVTTYEEGDSDPTGGFPTGPGSLGDALKAVHGTTSWCSNPYIERGEKNAQTNCIGCHQHAGTGLISEDVLFDEKQFPLAGRTQVRQNFPADYTYATSAAPENLGQVMQNQIGHFDAIDP